MSKLYLTTSHSIIKNGQAMKLDQLVYNITDEKLMKENDFFKCHKCKNWFDEIHELTIFHPKHDGKEYCSSCIQ